MRHAKTEFALTTPPNPTGRPGSASSPESASGQARQAGHPGLVGDKDLLDVWRIVEPIREPQLPDMRDDPRAISIDDGHIVAPHRDKNAVKFGTARTPVGVLMSLIAAVGRA